MMVMPLFINVDQHLIPVGSAFAIGRGLGFVMTAAHNVMEAVAREPKFDQVRTSGSLLGSLSLDSVGLSVLHQQPGQPGKMTLTFLPLASVEAASPSDIVIGFARLPEGTPSLALPLSFVLPQRGETVWSVGYHDFRYPPGGIPLEAVRDGTFDWRKDYSHTLTVAEASVEAAFTSRFATGFVEGPCFAIDETIKHGMSGGPVISESGSLVGLNSAGAEMFFGRPMSIASMLLPLLLTGVRFGGSFGPVTLNVKRSLIDLIGQGIIQTDRSEERVGLSSLDDKDGPFMHATAPIGAEAVYEDFSAYQQGRPALPTDSETYHFVRQQLEDKAESDRPPEDRLNDAERTEAAGSPDTPQRDAGDPPR